MAVFFFPTNFVTMNSKNDWESFFWNFLFSSSVNLTNFAIFFAEKNYQFFYIKNLEKKEKKRKTPKKKKTPMVHEDFLMERVINDCNYCVGNQVNCLMIIHNIYNKLGVHNFASKEVKDKKPDQNKNTAYTPAIKILTPKGNLKHHLMFTIVLYTFKCLTIGLKSNAFCWQLCDVAKVGVIHRKISLNLATS
jgi:hypothetical protein